MVSSQLREPQVKVISQSRRPSGATQLTCSISGRGELDKVVRLLYEFYSVDVLHRIRRLPMNPITDSKQMTVNLTVEALILPTASVENQFVPEPTSAIAERPLEDWSLPIITRNMFAPPNEPPRLDLPRRPAVVVGDDLALPLKAFDPDPLDQVGFQLVEAPEGVTLDPASGQLQWTPTQAGEYELVVRAVDDGMPPLQAEASVVVVVGEPPPPVAAAEPVETKKPLRFDDARFTFAVASLEVGGQRQLWLQVRTRGQIVKVFEGDSIEIGSVQAHVTRILADGAQLQADDQSWWVGLGDPLVSSTGS